MGIQRRILVALALVALGGCDPDSGRSDGRRESVPDAPARPSASRPSPATDTDQAATTSKAHIEIADEGGGANPLPNTGTAILPLAHIIRIAQARVLGEVIEVELDDEDGRPEYEITILTADGRSIEIKIDARSGSIRKTEED